MSFSERMMVVVMKMMVDGKIVEAKVNGLRLVWQEEGVSPTGDDNPEQVQRSLFLPMTRAEMYGLAKGLTTEGRKNPK